MLIIFFLYFADSTNARLSIRSRISAFGRVWSWFLPDSSEEFSAQSPDQASTSVPSPSSVSFSGKPKSQRSQWFPKVYKICSETRFERTDCKVNMIILVDKLTWSQSYQTLFFFVSNFHC